jgi:hypothetical protein
MQHFLLHLGFKAGGVGQLTPHGTIELSKHFTMHVGHDSSQPTVIAPLKQVLVSVQSPNA